jgi:phosphoribosylanthranilate isomerase
MDMGQPVRVKICGITCPEDLDDAVAAGADAVGLNFHPASPRCLVPLNAEQIIRRLPPFVEAVAVLVNRSVAVARTEVENLHLRTFQIHGGAPEVVDAFPYRYIPAFQVRDESDLAAIDRYLDACRQANALPAAVLVDGHAPGLHGGTGRRAPWDLLAQWRPAVPLILAGGLTPDNVAEAVRRVRPWAVDTASGVESSPGRKDAEKVRRFIAEARAAATR